MKSDRFSSSEVTRSLQDDQAAEPPLRPGDAQDGGGDARFDPGALGQPSGPDPFDPASLRLSPDQTASLVVKKALLAVPVRKPHKSWFVRVHPDPTFRLQTAVIEEEGDRGKEIYLVAKDLWPDLAWEPTFRPKVLAAAINRQNVLFLWEVNLPREDGRPDAWTKTALDAIELATKRWVRVAANMSLGAYDVWEATGQLNDPDWPPTPFPQILRTAFHDRFINELSHPVLRRRREEV